MAPTSVWTETRLGAEKSIPSLQREFGIYTELKVKKNTIKLRTYLRCLGSIRRNSEGSVPVLSVVFVLFDDLVCSLMCSSHR